jgi:hypothetical protein
LLRQRRFACINFKCFSFQVHRLRHDVFSYYLQINARQRSIPLRRGGFSDMGLSIPTAPRGRQSHANGTSQMVLASRRLRCCTDAAGVMLGLGDSMASAGVACRDGGVTVGALHAPALVQRNHVAVLSLPKMPRPGSIINHGIGNQRVS